MNRLLELEQQVLEEGREWTRQRLEARLQKEAQKIELEYRRAGMVLKEVRLRPLELRTVCGVVRIKVRHGYDPQQKRWICPPRQVWGLKAYQRVSPELQARLCYTATEVSSFETAAHMARRWGTPCSDDMIHHQVQNCGAKAAELELPPTPAAIQEAEFSLVIMMDGWMVRERSKDWGASPRKKNAQRIAWRDVKSAVIYRLDQRAEKEGGRGLLLEKFVVASPPLTDPLVFGAEVQKQAMRRGLARAERVYLVMDGAVYLWALAEDRFPQAIKTLDFHHASQHLWAVGHALYGEDTPEARQWVEPLLHQLRHGEEIKTINALEELLAKNLFSSRSQAGQTLQRETEYFRKHQDHLHYQLREKEGAPIGSGAVESLGGQLQRRFKTCDQFWMRQGLTHLLALSTTFRNHDDPYLWN
jgi:hypothetical protein